MGECVLFSMPSFTPVAVLALGQGTDKGGAGKLCLPRLLLPWWSSGVREVEYIDTSSTGSAG